jgi:alkanesulfonate monooxygenase SsuD/methylene tetrahydromethanopterin reductase-like flavin-dependent oxidoreductase (luciferase family)
VNVGRIRSALFLPPFDELAEPTAVAGLAAEAEEAGWDGFFLWDHIAYRSSVSAIADPWVVLSAMACATERIRLGPLVTPLPRRRPAVVARQTATLDRLSKGRLVLGVGTGGDGSGELSSTGEELADRVRGDMLDEHLSILRAAWTGAAVRHRGEHYVVDGLTFLPTPVQPGGPPIWVGARYGNPRPLRRAAQHDGVFPIEIEEPAQLAEVVADVRSQRSPESAYDVVIGHPPGTDPAPWEAAGATWWLVEFGIDDLDLDRIRGVVRAGPPS